MFPLQFYFCSFKISFPAWQYHKLDIPKALIKLLLFSTRASYYQNSLLIYQQSIAEVWDIKQSRLLESLSVLNDVSFPLIYGISCMPAFCFPLQFFILLLYVKTIVLHIFLRIYGFPTGWASGNFEGLLQMVSQLAQSVILTAH